MHKAEWNGVINDNSFAEIRGGQYGYDWTNGVNGTGLRYEDIGNNLIHGRNRNWARERRRNQVLGTISYFKNSGPAITTSSSAARSSTRPSTTSSSTASKKTSCT